MAAFAVSSTASNLHRVGKPFNPLLGETYELVRYVVDKPLQKGTRLNDAWD